MGARILKTGLAVTIAATFCTLLKIPIIFAVLSAVVNMKPSVVQSWKNASEQVSVHLLGVLVAFLIGLTLGSSPLTIGLTTVTVISLCVRLGLRDGSVMGILAALFVLTAPPAEFVPHAWIRTQAIFIGLSAAYLVNLLILPPRYGQRLRAILGELSNEVTAYFVLTIIGYVNKQQVDQLIAQRQNKIISLIQTSKDLLSRYKEQIGRAKPSRLTPGRDPEILSAFLSYITSLYERSLYIEALIPERIQRRQEAGNQPISPEFQQILVLMQKGADRVVYLNQELEKTLFQEEKTALEPVIENYWDDLAQVIEEWHSKISGSYYLHALLEVGAVVGDIKWAATKARELHQHSRDQQD